MFLKDCVVNFLKIYAGRQVEFAWQLKLSVICVPDFCSVFCFKLFAGVFFVHYLFL